MTYTTKAPILCSTASTADTKYCPQLGQKRISALDIQNPAQIIASLKEQFSIVFEEGLGRCTHFKAHLNLRPNVQPVFCKARPVPIAARKTIEDELHRLEKLGAIRQVDFSDWAAPILAVTKKSGSIRVCSDFSTGLNEALELNRHPLPRPEDLFMTLNGASIFTQLDLSDAYLQIELDAESKKLVCVNTHMGLFQYERLPFGVKSAPSIFQKFMDQLLTGIDGTVAYIDDVVVASSSIKEHILTLRKLFTKFQSYGLKVNLNKCHFLLK